MGRHGAAVKPSMTDDDKDLHEAIQLAEKERTQGISPCAIPKKNTPDKKEKGRLSKMRAANEQKRQEDKKAESMQASTDMSRMLSLLAQRKTTALSAAENEELKGLMAKRIPRESLVKAVGKMNNMGELAKALEEAEKDKNGFSLAQYTEEDD